MSLNQKPQLALFCAAFALAGCSSDDSDPNPTNKPGPVGTTLRADEVKFEEAAGTPFGPNGELVQFGAGWGDRASGAHGTFGIFPAGAVSPPHTHTSDYHGVVISGVMSNPFGTEASPVELPAGSHWYVPAGEQHVTQCMSTEPCVFYFHSEGAFDFAPVDKLTEPRSASAQANPASEVKFEEAEGTPFGPNGERVQFGAGFGDRSVGEHGTFGIFPGLASSPSHTHSDDYYGVVITGTMTNPFNGDNNPGKMPPGSLWTVPGKSVHVTTCASTEPCTFYFHARGKFDFTPAG